VEMPGVEPGCMKANSKDFLASLAQSED